MLIWLCDWRKDVAAPSRHDKSRGRERARQADGYKQIAGHEVYRYSNRLSSGWSWDRADYNVVFKNEPVVEYGAGQVRPKSCPSTYLTGAGGTASMRLGTVFFS